MDFSIHPRSQFSLRRAMFTKPKIVGFFTTDDRMNYKKDASHIKLLRVPNGEIHFDLNHGLDKTKKWVSEETSLSVLLKHLLREKCPLGSSNLRDASFITTRFVLKVLATAIYDSKNAKKFSACLFQGCIYMCKLNTEEESERYDKMKFKTNLFKLRRGNISQYMLADDPNDEIFHCVLKSKLNNHKLLYASNANGLQSNDLSIKIPDCRSSPNEYIAFLQNSKLIKLKTCPDLHTSYQRMNYRRCTIMHWWTQCFLGGVETLFCGYHNYAGIVSEVKSINVSDLVAEGERFWQWNLVLMFLDYFLNYVRGCFDAELKKKYGNLKDVDIRQLGKMDLIFDISSAGDVKMSVADAEDLTCLPSWFVNESAALGEYCEKAASGSQSCTS